MYIKHNPIIQNDACKEFSQILPSMIYMEIVQTKIYLATFNQLALRDNHDDRHVRKMSYIEATFATLIIQLLVTYDDHSFQDQHIRY